MLKKYSKSQFRQDLAKLLQIQKPAFIQQPATAQQPEIIQQPPPAQQPAFIQQPAPAQQPAFTQQPAPSPPMPASVSYHYGCQERTTP